MSEPIRAVDRALDILSCFTPETPALTMTQISEQVGMHKSTVHRLLSTMEGRKFLERNPLTGMYRPGIRLFQLAFLTLEQNDLRRISAPFLHELCQQHQENVNLTILDGTDVVYLDVVESPQRVKLAAVVGQRLPAHCTASGKAILAFLPDESVKKILDKGITKQTQHTISTMEALLENFKAVRKNGFAFSEQEYENGINAVAAPLLDEQERPFASISIAGPSFRLTKVRMQELGPVIKNIAHVIAHETSMIIRS